MTTTYSTIVLRRGEWANFDKTKLAAGELAVVLGGDTENSTDGRSFYLSYGGGVVKQIATASDVANIIANQVDGIKAELTEDIEAEIDKAETAITAANTATTNANGATTKANSATSAANTAASSANTAASSANTAASSANTAASSANTAAEAAEAALEAISPLPVLTNVKSALKLTMLDDYASITGFTVSVDWAYQYGSVLQFGLIARKTASSDTWTIPRITNFASFNFAALGDGLTSVGTLFDSDNRERGMRLSVSDGVTYLQSVEVIKSTDTSSTNKLAFTVLTSTDFSTATAVAMLDENDEVVSDEVAPE